MTKKNATVAARQRNKAASARNAGPAPTKPASLGAGGTEVSRKVARSAKSGEFVSKQAAKRAPSTTVTETVKTKRKAAPQNEEQRFVLVPVDGIGWERPGTDNPGDGLIAGNYEQMTKAEILSTLADEVLSGPAAVIPKNKVFKIPAKLAAAADLLYTTRQERLALNKHVEAMKVHERALKEHLIDSLPKSDASGVAGKVARAQVKIEDEPIVEDWETFYKGIKKTGAFELLNKAPNRRAIKERWNNGKEVPGVGHFDNVKISLTKVGG